MRQAAMITILHISDLHFFSPSLQSLFEKANELQGKEHLEKILSRCPQVKGYMHGHSRLSNIALHTFVSGSEILCAEPGPFGARSYELKNFFSKRRFPFASQERI